MKCALFLPALVAGLLLGGLVSCGGKKASETDAKPAPEVIMRVGDSILTRQQVVAMLPAGISAADSGRLFDAIVEEWLERNMVVDIALKTLPDMERIDRMVEQYRRQLLAQEYRRLNVGEVSKGVSEDSLLSRYNSRPEAYTLQQPVVKGIYLKIPTSSPQLAEVKSWVKSASTKDIDQLESYGLKGAMEYDNFTDSWIAWEEILSHVPARIASHTDVPLKGKTIDLDIEGTTYLVHITESLPAGERMPFALARPLILQEITEGAREDFDRKMLRDIYRREIDNRRIRPGTYVPVRYRSSKPENSKI